MKRLSLSIQIFIGLGLGVLLGLLLMDKTHIAVMFFKPVGDVFMGLIKFIVAPVVFCTIIRGVLSIKDMKKMGILGGRTLLFFLSTTAAAAILALIVANIFKGFFTPLPTQGLQFTPPPTLSITDVLANFIPSNIIKPFAENNMVQIVFVSIMFGLGILAAKEKGKSLADFFDNLCEVSVKIMEGILKLSPIAVCAMVGLTVAENGLKLVGSLLLLVVVTYIGFILHFLLVYFPAVKFLAKYNPVEFMKKMAPAMLLAFSSASSIAALPQNMQCCENMGVKKPVFSFVLPLGATINMDGAAIYLCICSFFIAACYSIQLTFINMLSIATVAIIASVGSAGVPGSAVVMLSMVLAGAGLPPEGIALVIGIDRIIDMGRTVVNITGDAVCALCVSKSLPEISVSQD